MHYIQSAVQILKDFTYINTFLLQLHFETDFLDYQEILQVLSKLDYSIQIFVCIKLMPNFGSRGFNVKSLHVLNTNNNSQISFFQSRFSSRNPKQEINPLKSITNQNSYSHNEKTDSNSSHKKYSTRKATGRLNPQVPHQDTEIDLILKSSTYSNSEEVIESRLDKYLKRKCEFSEPPTKKLKETGQSTIFKFFKRPYP